MFRKIRYAVLALAVIFSSFTAYSIWKSTLPLISPIVLIEVITGHAPANNSAKIIYGFFPYWNLKYAENLNVTELTHFAYFAVDLNPDGSINKINSKKEQEPGWNKLNSKTFEKLLYQTKLLDQKTVLTVTAMDQDTISSLTTSPETTRKAIESILTVYRDYHFDNLNVDFEYVGEPDQKTRDGFTAFVKDLKSSCVLINHQCRVDIDIFADSGEKYRLWDLTKLEPFTDHFIVMAYDYYRKSSSQAGPIAPLTGKCSSTSKPGEPCLEEDILTHISRIIKLLPSEKILLGIPFYGYQWQTVDRNYLANTYPKTGALASYQRIQSLFSDPDISSLSAEWSDVTLSPYLVFEKDDQIFQIQFESPQSLEQKIKFIKSANLGGIAIWALGYETPYNDLWQAIKELRDP